MVQIRKILRLERAHGYNDDAVMCGLEEFIRLNFPTAARLVSGYGQLKHFDRQRAITQLEERIAQGEPGSPATPSVDDLFLPVQQAEGVGKKRVTQLQKLGIHTIEDLLTYFPRRLEDRSRFLPIGELSSGIETCVRGEIAAISQIHVNSKMDIVKAAIRDDSGVLYAVWFNQPWIAKQLKRGEKIDVYGKVERTHGTVQMSSPVWEPANEGFLTGRLVPVYPVTEGMSDRYIRLLINRHLKAYGSLFRDLLPGPLRKKYHLPNKREAVQSIHFPKDYGTFTQARRALAFEELFLLQLGLASSARKHAGRSHVLSSRLADSFLASLSFSLTVEQSKALGEIVSDLGQDEQMMRLLQGDVGSGKTIVALTAALYAIEAGNQVAFMVPTEILAEQHFYCFRRLLSKLPVRVELLTSTSKSKELLKARIASGEVDLVIGTHALIQQDVSFKVLGFVVIDEQHRFGVVQRSLLEEKGEQIDLLVMSATPIPRTITLTFYGEFAVSLIEQLPTGKKQTHTLWVASSRRDEIYSEVRRQLETGGRGYVILPLVEESEKFDLKAAAQVAEELRSTLAPFPVGLVHGRLPTEEKTQVMNAFRSGKIRILVATTVIEVGIDVCSADFMVIEHANRFGLSQLHQLRGRIGRAGQPSTCFAISDAKTEEAKRRLSAFVDCLDGFAIAEEDLRIRGPGDLLGTQQHGFLSKLRAVDLVHDVEIMIEARREAQLMQKRGVPDAVTQAIERRFGEFLAWLRV
ncbi:ATP-dependent DNA helicase RecG [Candidatus Bipolaricaulota bacterium]|nr:ATP-dependent DNA helicase RecG [Candidatus Bipolaricaulota bacterium]